MNKSKILAAMVLAIFVSNSLVFGQQQWGGAQDSTGSIFRAGKVGIGTQNPAAMLHLKNFGNIFKKFETIPSLFFEGGIAHLAVLKNQSMLFGHWDGTVFTERLRIDQGGRLGIGTKGEPEAQLEINSEGGDQSTLRVYSYPRPDDPDDPMVKPVPDLTKTDTDDPVVLPVPDLPKPEPDGKIITPIVVKLKKPIFPAFDARNLRRDGQAGYFYITNTSNSSSALYVQTNGTGHALELSGPENTGTTATLKITSSGGQNMLLDGNEIDAVADGLYLNKNSRGAVVVPVLEITGGSDLAEPFEIEGAEIVQPGMVVTIDPEQPGKLRIAGKAYDRTVAGIVSGANGLNPGLMMKQADSIGDGTHPIALTGRVYCWAEASNGSIQPGDLLTTSGTPGHAMKVADYAVAQGAIIGKAMTALEKGKGLVLVLVSLQ